MQNIINFQYFLSTHPMIFALLIVWSIAWKGFALWKAGKNRSFIWFIVLLLVNTIGILEIIYLFAIKDKNSKPETTPSAPEMKTDASTSSATETKVETVVEEKKEEIPAAAPEVSNSAKSYVETKKAEEINHEEIIPAEVKPEEVKQEINQ